MVPGVHACLSNPALGKSMKTEPPLLSSLSAPSPRGIFELEGCLRGEALQD